MVHMSRMRGGSGVKTALVIIAAMLITQHLWANDAMDTQLGKAVEALAREAGRQRSEAGLQGNANGSQVVAVGTITYADTGIGSEFSAYVGDKMEGSLRASDRFMVSDNRNLDEIMEQMKLAMSGFADETRGPEIGRLRTATALLEGTYHDTGSGIEVVLELTEVESGLSIAGTRLILDKKEIPAGISLLPENYATAKEVLGELSKVMDEPGEGLSIFAWTDRGNGATYRDGDDLVIRFYANRPCFLKLYHIDVHKKASLIFPNEYYSDNRIEAGKVYSIPDEHYPFRFELGAPYGTEFIKIVASTRQFEEIEKAFEEIGKAHGGIMTRGLALKRKDELRAEDLISYTIVE